MNHNFVHVVYFWFKNPNSEIDRNFFETSLKKFMDASAFAQTRFIGKSAEIPREVVDNSFTYSLICSFVSKEEQNEYQIEPPHLVFVEECKHLWEKVVVYDSVGI